MFRGVVICAAVALVLAGCAATDVHPQAEADANHSDALSALIGGIARMLGIGSEPELGQRLQNAGAALQSVDQRPAALDQRPIGVGVNANACPVGSFPWVDSWGNQIATPLILDRPRRFRVALKTVRLGRIRGWITGATGFARASTTARSITTRRPVVRLGRIRGWTTGAIRSAVGSETGCCPLSPHAVTSALTHSERRTRTTVHPAPS